MKRIRYTKYVPDPAGEMSMEDLLGALSDYLLQSGFQNYLSYYDLPDGEQTLDDLRDAIEQALLDSDLLSEELRQQMQGQGSLDELIERSLTLHLLQLLAEFFTQQVAVQQRLFNGVAQVIQRL